MVRTNDLQNTSSCTHENKPSRLTSVSTVATQLPALDYSHGPIPLFWFAKGCITTNETKYTNDEYESFTRVHTSKCVVTFVPVKPVFH